jgi:hypothetical protein
MLHVRSIGRYAGFKPGTFQDLHNHAILALADFNRRGVATIDHVPLTRVFPIGDHANFGGRQDRTTCLGVRELGDMAFIKPIFAILKPVILPDICESGVFQPWFSRCSRRLLCRGPTC